MDILKGLLYINDKDVYLTYGAFLSEDKEGDDENYSALMTPPAVKPYTSVNFREQTGEKLPSTLKPVFEARDITLQFAIVGTSQTDFLNRYSDFINMLKSGWLNIRVPELRKTYKVHYQSCSKYSQLTPLDGNDLAGKFKVKFREPQPSF